MRERLKYLGYAITFQEIPDEITLTINISGCRYRCRGCHSKHLWEYKGNYLLDDLETLIKQYEDMISCVCFMGGDQNLDELKTALNICKQNKLITALYTGCSDKKKLHDILPLLDWLKLGKYDDTKLSDNHIEYGVKLASTNQHLYKMRSL